MGRGGRAVPLVPRGRLCGLPLGAWHGVLGTQMLREYVLVGSASPNYELLLPAWGGGAATGGTRLEGAAGARSQAEAGGSRRLGPPPRPTGWPLFPEGGSGSLRRRQQGGLEWEGLAPAAAGWGGGARGADGARRVGAASEQRRGRRPGGEDAGVLGSANGLCDI